MEGTVTKCNTSQKHKEKWTTFISLQSYFYKKYSKPKEKINMGVWWQCRQINNHEKEALIFEILRRSHKKREKKRQVETTDRVEINCHISVAVIT